jgi:hypothetical protein
LSWILVIQDKWRLRTVNVFQGLPEKRCRRPGAWSNFRKGQGGGIPDIGDAMTHEFGDMRDLVIENDVR